MTLDELLALLPDNDQGKITAAAMRTVVTELFGQVAAAGKVIAPLRPTDDLTNYQGQVGELCMFEWPTGQPKLCVWNGVGWAGLGGP